MQTNFEVSFNNISDLVLTPTELRDLYMWGVQIQDKDGVELPNNVIQHYIKFAQEQLENYLGIKLLPQTIKESIHFNLQNWKNWGYVRVTYPVVCPKKLTGLLNRVRQIDVPSEWLSSKKTPDGKLYHRNIFIIPSGDSSPQTYATIFSGTVSQYGLVNSNFVPNYWEVEYITGFEKVPGDLKNVIGRLAAINLFHIAGDLILGAGIASFSIGIDGLSQSISTTSSATNAGYGARIQGYWNDLKRELPLLKDYYRGFMIGGL